MRSLLAFSLALATLTGGVNAAFGQVTPPLEPFRHREHPTFTIPQSSVHRAEDAGQRMHTNMRFAMPNAINSPLIKRSPDNSPMAAQPVGSYVAETPASLQCLYGVISPNLGSPKCNPATLTAVANGGSRAIAIVDAYGYDRASRDLATYSAQFGLPYNPAQLKIYYAARSRSGDAICGGPSPRSNADWEGEQALDLQMAHAVAPNATLLLVQAQSDSVSDLLNAVACANSLLSAAPYNGGQVSMSWGGGEFFGQDSYDRTYFSTPNVVYFASSGDSAGVIWPSTSPNVVAVGGTTISRKGNYDFNAHLIWPDTGGGVSTIYSRPTYQNNITGLSSPTRAVPDISAIADPNTGVWVYDSNPVYGTGWYIFGGTSASAPLIAGMTNVKGTFRASTTAELTALYAAKRANATNNFKVPSLGFCGPYASYVYNGGSSWNYCIGLGTVQSNTPL